MLKKIISLFLLLTFVVSSLPFTAMAQQKPEPQKKRPHGKVVYIYETGKTPDPGFYDDQDKFGTADVYPAVGKINISADPIVKDGLGGAYKQKMPNHQEIVLLEKPITKARVMTKYGYWVEGELPVTDIKGQPIYILKNKNTGGVLAVVNCGNPAWFDIPKPQPPPAPTPDPKASLTLQKVVKSLDANDDYSAFTEVKQNGKVRYRLKFKNNGTVPAINVRLTDDVKYSSNYFKILPDSVIRPSDSRIVGDALVLNVLNPGEEKVVEYSGIITQYDGRLVNNATLTADNADTVYDKATVTVTRKTDPIPEKKVPSVEITKNVLNVTAGEKSFKKSTVANKNHIVRFELLVQNPGEADAHDLVITDDYAGEGALEYNLVKGSKLEDGVTLDGNKFRIAILRKNEAKRITYEAKVKAEPERELTNHVEVTCSENISDSDDAILYLKKSGWSLEKKLIVGGIIGGAIVTAIILAGGGSSKPTKSTNGPPIRP